MKPLIESICEAIADLPPDEAIAIVDGWLDDLSDRELAALGADWPHTWARESQRFPEGEWRSHIFITSRRHGKTRSCAEFVNAEAASGRAPRIGFMAQNLEKTLEVMAHGEAGLVATSPPWFRAHFEAGRVIWPNGAAAYPFSPEVPQTIRGPGVHLFWASEIQSWPAAHRDEAWANASIMATLGYGRVIGDCTPKKRHPLLRKLLERSAAAPHLHRIVRGTIRENIDNLGVAAVAELEADLLGTQRGREELLGEYTDQDDAALFRAVWFERTRRALPAAFKRKIISIDPSITSDSRFSDRTGIVCMGLGVDDQIIVTADLTGVHRHEVWSAMVVDRYTRDGASLITIETNRGGDTHVALLRVACRDRGLQLVELGPLEVQDARPGIVYVRPHHTRNTKAERAGAAAALCERGRVSFVDDPSLAPLLDALCDFTGEGKGPDDAIDAFVHGCFELGKLGTQTVDPKLAFRGITEMAAALRNDRHAPRRHTAVADLDHARRLLSSSVTGRRIL